MKFKIDPSIFEKFPRLNIGVLLVKGIDNRGMSEEVVDLLRKKQKDIQASFDIGTLSQNPKIDSWRKAYSLFGAKPKKYKCSVENLYRMTLEGIELKHINKLVDIYNYISLKHIVPVGGDDTDKVEGNITLTFAEGNERFAELNSDEIKNPHKGEVIYMDNKEVLCRRWNWRECDKSKMTENTKNAALVVEGLFPFTKEDVEIAINELKNMIKKYCGGESQSYVLNAGNHEIELK